MYSLTMLLSLGEALVLVLLLIAMLRLRGRVRHIDHDANVHVMQMRDLVQEAQSLSTMLASQLASQAKLADQAPVARKPLAGVERTAAVPAAPAVKPALITHHVLPDAADLDREAARERGMDPLGLALQRSLYRGVQTAS